MEEVGISAKLKSLGSFKHEDKCKVWGNLFYVKIDTDGSELKFNKDEIQELKFLSKTEILSLIVKFKN